MCVAWSALLGCTAELGLSDSESESGDTVATGGGDGDALDGVEGGTFEGASCTAIDSASTVRRLNTLELGHVVVDVFGEDETLFSGLAGDPVGFKTIGSSLSSDPLFTDDYWVRIEEMSGRQATALLDQATCDPAVDQRGCAEELLEPLARVLYRRPVTAEMTSQVLDAVDEVTLQLDFEAGLQAGIMALLTSPHFLFTDVDDSTPQTRPATSNELAERLALTIWLSVPDEALLAAASTDALQTDEGLNAEIDRLLADPKADRFLLHFAEQWLALDSIGSGRVDAEALGLELAEWDQLVVDMKTETRLFVRDVFENGGSVSTLITARYSMLNDSLAEFYGLPTTGAPGFTRRDFPAGSPRQGVLTHGSVLLQGASGTHPEIVKRGATILNRFLCRPPPAPPVGVEEEVELQLASGASERERMEERASIPACSGCHQELDPLGYSFHSFDAAGRHRTIDEEGHEIDTLVEYQGQAFDNANAVLDYLGEEGITECVTQNLLTYSLGRNYNVFDNEDDDCLASSIAADVSDTSFSSLIRGVLTSALYRSRSVAE